MYNFYIFYGYPSLFRDGFDVWSDSSPGDWRDSVEARMSRPSPVTITTDGYYNPGLDTGWFSASFRNDSSAAFTARVYFVITEDSLYHLDPNGHAWHNHLARDMLTTQIGEQVTINPSETVTITRELDMDPTWVKSHLYIVTWIQRDAPSRDVLQAEEVVLLSLPGVEENTNLEVHEPGVSLVSNPCAAENIKFALDLPENTLYQIDIYDILGRQVMAISGISAQGTDVTCNLNQNRLERASSGVYLYRFASPVLNTTGKIIVR